MEACTLTALCNADIQNRPSGGEPPYMGRKGVACRRHNLENDNIPLSIPPARARCTDCW